VPFDPARPARSAAHVRRHHRRRRVSSDDDGETWSPVNQDVPADFLGDPYPEVGQCPHKLLLHPAQPNRLWQQNHFGVFRSDDQRRLVDAARRQRPAERLRLPAHARPDRSRRGLRHPGDQPEYHYSPGARLAVYGTADGGTTWDADGRRAARTGLGGVLREGSASDAESLYFGTQSGSFFALTDGDQWVEAVRHLPPILSVEVTSWSR
jgi:hypothetical protein